MKLFNPHRRLSPTIAKHCPKCQHFFEIDLPQGNFSCPGCAHHWGKIVIADEIFNECPVCGCRQFYLSKDLNQALGCFIMLIGILLVPKTYGLSLPVFAFVDFLLAKRVPSTINCYRCGTEYRNFQTPKKFKPFMHHIGLKYDKYR